MSQLLSYVIPAYNEEKTLEDIVGQVLKTKLPKGYEKEVIIVNDCSKDKTESIAKSLAKTHSEVKVLTNKTNLGKSQTVRRGILESTGDYVVIQDADLEYDPLDIVFLFEQLLHTDSDVAYGNRFGKYNGVIYWKNFLGNVFLSFISNLFTIRHNRVYIPDMEVCYKIIRGDVARELAKNLKSKSNFGFEPEITAKLSKYRFNNEQLKLRKKKFESDPDYLKFIILPISYYPRSIAQGKKMKAFQDGFKALGEIIRFNIF